jgi:hypothetical protein
MNYDVVEAALQNVFVLIPCYAMIAVTVNTNFMRHASNNLDV